MTANLFGAGTALVAFLASLAAAPRADAAQANCEFFKLVDTATPVPGSEGTFYLFGSPSIDAEGNVVFYAYLYPDEGAYGGDGTGLYLAAGGEVRVIADRSVPIPGTASTFAYGFRSYGASIDAGRVAFYAFVGRSEDNGLGVYMWNDGEVLLVADRSTPIPGGTGTFNLGEDMFGFGPFSYPSIRGNEIAFRGAAEYPELGNLRERGIYAWIDGQLDVIADLKTPIPACPGTFNFLSAEVSVEGGKMAFRAGGEEAPMKPRGGIYTDLSGTLAKIADTADSIPGGDGLFTSVEFPRLDGGKVYFAGFGANGQQGIYVGDGTSIARIVDTRTPIPWGDGTFTNFSIRPEQFSASAGAVLFRGEGVDGQQGIYFARGPQIEKVIDNSDTLDGKTPIALNIGPEALRNSVLAFTATFCDSKDAQGNCIYSSAIYVGSPVFLRGEVNLDGEVDLSDAISVLIHLFVAAPARVPCMKSEDADDSGDVGIGDAISILMFLFLMDAAPPLPFPRCGSDPTPDGLACEWFPPCR